MIEVRYRFTPRPDQSEAVDANLRLGLPILHVLHHVVEVLGKTRGLHGQ